LYINALPTALKKNKVELRSAGVVASRPQLSGRKKEITDHAGCAVTLGGSVSVVQEFAFNPVHWVLPA
jgi:hypothetical protein